MCLFFEVSASLT